MTRKLAYKFNIQYLRLAKKDLLGSTTNVRRVVYFLWKKDVRLFDTNHFQKPDYFVSLDWIKNFEEFFRKLPKGEIELACHPEREEEFAFIEKHF